MSAHGAVDDSLKPVGLMQDVPIPDILLRALPPELAAAVETTPEDRREFTLADQLLLTEAQRRFEFEQKSADALHSKGTLFLTLVGIFLAASAALVGRTVDHPHGVYSQVGATCLVMSLGLLALSAARLARSALTRSYEVIAAPLEWLGYTERLREQYKDAEEGERLICDVLQRKLLGAWAKAADVCSVANEAKATTLLSVARLLSVAVVLTFLGAGFSLLQALP